MLLATDDAAREAEAEQQTRKMLYVLSIHLRAGKLFYRNAGTRSLYSIASSRIVE